MLSENESSFSINTVGETTGERYQGAFKCKIRLSMRDNITKDALRRQLLGSNPVEASPIAGSIATAAGELAVRIIEAPGWWKASDNGLELEDSSVMIEVYNNCVRLENEYRESIQKKAEEAKPELKAKLAEESK